MAPPSHCAVMPRPSSGPVGTDVSLSEIGLQIVSAPMTAQLIETILSTAFFGLYTSLAIIAFWNLCRKGFKTACPVIMVLVVFALYASTVVYWIIGILQVFQKMAEIVYDATSLTESNISVIYRSLDDTTTVTDDSRPRVAQFAPPLEREMQWCVGTVSLTTNIILGDAIVWWRAWVLWRKNRIVQSLCLFLMFATSVTSITVTTQACLPYTPRIPAVILVDPSHQGGVTVVALGSLFIGDKRGLAASILSLITNIAATSLIAYKAWVHRSAVAPYLGAGPTGTRVEKILALFVESGIVYCILWVLVVVYQSETLNIGHGNDAAQLFIFRFHYVVEGCLVSIIGIYPTLIVVLVALNKSHCDTNFTYGAKIDRVPTSTARTSLHFRVPAMSGQAYSESSVSVEDIPSSDSIDKHVRHCSAVDRDTSFSRAMVVENQEELVYHAV